MKRVISASRRTDLVASFPAWLASALRQEKAEVYGPSKHVYSVDLNPANVHTIVLWSKNFQNLVEDRFGLAELLMKYDQAYLHFTITGLGGTFIEQTVPPLSKTLLQLECLGGIVGRPERISVRFDPVVFWEEGGKIETNLRYFEELAPTLSSFGIRRIRFSFAQWYGKSRRRAEKHGFAFIDPTDDEKREKAQCLAEAASRWNLELFACSQEFLTSIPSIEPSSCIDGLLLQKLHPSGEMVSLKKDKTQRKECRCTESVDIGSYTQFCPHCCLYCYANPKI
jgi:hypothetical protein